MIVNYNFEDKNNDKLIIIRIETENLLYVFDFSLDTNITAFLEFVRTINSGTDNKLTIENEEEIVLLTYKSGVFHIQCNENSLLYIKDSSTIIQTFNDICNDICNSTI